MSLLYAEDMGGDEVADEETNAFVQWRHAPPAQWRFCPLCRADLVDRSWDGKVRRYCPNCGFVYWERPLPAAAAVIVRAERPSEIVLVRRRYPPEEGQWTLPGGGIEAGESVIEAAQREATEETGLLITIDCQLGTWSTPTKETVVTFFVAHPLTDSLNAGTDAIEARWFTLEEAPRLAFSTHRDALVRFIQRRGN